MAEVKSAFELALERAEKVKVNKDELQADLALTEGKKIAAKALADEKFELLEAIDKASDKFSKELLLEGITEVLLANLVLPSKREDLAKFLRIKAIFLILENDAEATFNHIERFITQYLDHKEQVILQLEEHFRPLLQQKQQEVFEQTGQRYQLKLDAIPEAQKAYQEQIGQFNRQYQEELDRTKWQFKQTFKLI